MCRCGTAGYSVFMVVQCEKPEFIELPLQFVLVNDNRKINAKSIMGIMAFNPTSGMSVNIVADGSDEKEALVAMEKFLVCS